MSIMGYDTYFSKEECLDAFLNFKEETSELSEWILETNLILDETQRNIEINRVNI